MILDNTLQQSDAQSQKQIKDETNNIIKPMSLCGAQLFYGADGKEMTKKIKDAIKLGFRYIDVSLYQYRQREIAVGILESISEGVVQRQDLFITCKLDPHQKMGYNEAIASVENSLKDLGLDYIDLYLIPYPNLAKDGLWKKINSETWRGLEKCYSEGKIKNIGVANFSILHLEELLKTAKILPFVNQLELSFQWQQNEVVNWCKQRNINCMSVIESVENIFEKNDELLNSVGGGAIRFEQDNIGYIENEITDEISKKYNKNYNEILIRWNLQKGYSVVISSDDVLNIKDLKVLDFNVSPKDMEKLDTLNARPVNPLKSPDCIFNYWMLENELYKKEVIKKVQFNFLLPLIKWKNKTPDVSKLYLFGFLPIMKFKISSFNNDIENFYLFNFIPILKSKKICNNAKNRNNSHKKKYYLFGIIPLFKKSLDMRFYRYKNNVIPNYDIETSLERKHANRSDRDYIFNQIHVSQKLYGYKKYTKLQDYFIKLRLKYAKKAIIAHQNVQVTNICTIKCAQCAHMIPYYKKENLHTMNFLEFKDYIDTLTKNVNRVYDMVLLGGEPLLNKDIAKMVKYSKKQRKIERTIIVTNASVIPSDELIKELKGAKNASIYISNYSKNVPKLQENFEKIVQLCKDNNIICNFVESYYWWQQPEIVIKEPKDIDKNLAQSNYERCSFKYCMMLSNGKMYPCARAVYINDEAGKKFDYEMLDFKKKNFTCDDFNKFISAEEFDICGCCDMKNYEKILLPAQQINNCKKQ